MARQSNGTYSQPANTAAVSGNTINSNAFNTLIADIGTEITNSLDRQGRSAMTAALPMGGQKITGMADPAVSSDGATKNYVDTTTATFFSTGDVKFTLKTAADIGWILFDDGTFGSASSGASSRANLDTQSLFTLFFNNFTDANAPILTSGGGATTRAAQTNASSAWAANCRMSLPKVLGRALGVAGTGSGLTARSLGQTVGEEAHTLVLNEIPTGIQSQNSAFSISTTTTGTAVVSGAGVSVAAGGNPITVVGSSSTLAATGNVAANAVTSSSFNTGGVSHNNMQPTTFLNCMVKL